MPSYDGSKDTSERSIRDKTYYETLVVVLCLALCIGEIFNKITYYHPSELATNAIKIWKKVRKLMLTQCFDRVYLNDYYTHKKILYCRSL